MTDPAARWADACHGAALFAVDPAGLGVALRARSGPVRDCWLAMVRALLPASTQLRRVPLGIADDRLLGGLDLAATLSAGRPVLGRGLLAEADGHVLVLPMAERISAATGGRLLAAQDAGEVVVERDGFAARWPFRAGVIALDEAAEPDEALPSALLDRLAMRFELDGLSGRGLAAASVQRSDVAAARQRLTGVSVDDAVVSALCGAAAALGIGSARAALFALRAARAAAALAGRSAVTEEDAALAARLVIASRATALPPPPASGPSEPEATEPEPGEAESPVGREPEQVDDVVLAAAVAALPPGLLASGAASPKSSPSQGRAAPGRAGSGVKSQLRGRPVGAAPGALGGGARLALIDTLRAAAPWQRLRGASPGRIAVRPSDVRIMRYRSRTRTTTVFAVDSSGSAARNRLAEAKGAVELLLAESYVRRDQVAVIGFRGRKAELLLPPTGSLVRAKRSLAGLPGGGATPLAAGLDAARELADVLRRRGDTPMLVLLTDGSANIARDGTADRSRATADALDAARRLRAIGCAAVLIDTAPRPQAQNRALAEALAARYLPLPYANAAAVSRVVAQSIPAAR